MFPPLLCFVIPTLNNIEPEVPWVFPVEKCMLPLFPSAAVPVEIEIDPLIPDLPAFSVLNLIFPLEDFVLYPLWIKILPPLPVFPAPPTIATDPPLPNLVPNAAPPAKVKSPPEFIPLLE